MCALGLATWGSVPADKESHAYVINITGAHSAKAVKRKRHILLKSFSIPHRFLKMSAGEIKQRFALSLPKLFGRPGKRKEAGELSFTSLHL